MTDGSDNPGLSIGDLATRSGVAVGTLRMWESRYGFPAPERLPSGHRRYSQSDLRQVRAVATAREEGLPLAMAIDRARMLVEAPRPSVYGALRERFAHLHPQSLAKPVLIAISHAIEDECGSRAQRPLLMGAFQRERFYRQAQTRWRALARGAACAIVLADFPRPYEPTEGPAEIPLAADDPLAREWVVICDAPELPACLIGWERPTDEATPRRFETLWTVEPEVVREAARVVARLAARQAPELVEAIEPRLAEQPGPVTAVHLRAAVELATRIAVYASGG